MGLPLTHRVTDATCHSVLAGKTVGREGPRLGVSSQEREPGYGSCRHWMHRCIPRYCHGMPRQYHDTVPYNQQTDIVGGPRNWVLRSAGGLVAELVSGTAGGPSHHRANERTDRDCAYLWGSGVDEPASCGEHCTDKGQVVLPISGVAP